MPEAGVWDSVMGVMLGKGRLEEAALLYAAELWRALVCVRFLW